MVSPDSNVSISFEKYGIDKITLSIVKFSRVSANIGLNWEGLNWVTNSALYDPNSGLL